MPEGNSYNIRASIFKNEVQAQLRAVTEYADREASIIFSEVCGLCTLDILCGAVVTYEQKLRVEEVLRRRLAREPLQYILGYAYFRNRKLKVNPFVLIPRPETELMVDWLKVEVGRQLALKNRLRALEIGVGSGAITASLLEELPGLPLRVDAVDISLEAIEIAKQNIDDPRASVFYSDLFSCVEGDYDIIFSNPPYIPLSEREEMQSEVKDHEPALALFAGDGYDIYKRILSQLKSRMRQDSAFIFEIGHDQFDCMKHMVAEYTGWTNARGELDYSGRRRFICLTNCNS